MTEKMALVLFSGSVDKLLAGGIMAGGAVAMDMEVDIFVTFWGLVAFRKDQVNVNQRMSKEFEDMAPALLQAMQAKHYPSWIDTFRKIRSMGQVRIHLCSMTMDMMGWKKEDFVDIVDDVIGVGSFIEMAKEAKVSLFL